MAMNDTRTIRLLVVEDNRAYLHLIQRAFHGRQEQIRWELTVAEDGEQALQLLFEEEGESAPLPDLILLDWNLPKVSGNEVLRRIKEHQKLRPIPGRSMSASWNAATLSSPFA
jgi:chemotaxis family two-component system response regulator Rcp1